MTWPDRPRIAVEDALVAVQEVVRLIDAGALAVTRGEASALREAVHSLRLIADKIDRGGDAVPFP